MNDNVTSKTPNEAFAKTRDYFLGNSLTPQKTSLICWRRTVGSLSAWQRASCQ